MSGKKGLKYLSAGIISPWLIAAALAAMFFYSLAQGVFIDICRSGDCRNLSIHLYPLDRPLFVWGAVFYAAASFLALNQRMNHLLPLVLLAAALGHTGLVVYAWSATGKFLYCSGCVTLWSSLIVVTGAAWLAKPYAVYQPRWKAARSFPLVLVGLAILVFMVNPVLSVRDAARWLGMDGKENAAAASPEPVPPTAEVGQPRVELIMPENSVTPVEEPDQQPAETAEALDDTPPPSEPAAGSTELKPGGSNAEGQSPAEPPTQNDKEKPSNEPYRLAVKTPAGAGLSLDLSSRPALLVSVKCSSCSKVLEEVSRLSGDKRPYIISLYLRESEKGKMGEKMSQAGLPAGSYYTTEADTPADSVPALMLWTGSSLETVEGIDRVIETLRR